MGLYKGVASEVEVMIMRTVGSMTGLAEVVYFLPTSRRAVSNVDGGRF